MVERQDMTYDEPPRLDSSLIPSFELKDTMNLIHRLVRDITFPITIIPASIVLTPVFKAYKRLSDHFEFLPPIEQINMVNTQSPFNDPTFIADLINNGFISLDEITLDIGGTGQISSLKGVNNVINLNYDSFNLREGDVQSDARNLPFQRESIKTGILSGVLSYFSEPKALEVLSEANSVLCDNGILLISEPQFHSLPFVNNFLSGVGENIAQQIIGVKLDYRDPEKMITLLHKAGFVRVERVPYKGKHGHKSYVLAAFKSNDVAFSLQGDLVNFDTESQRESLFIKLFGVAKILALLTALTPAVDAGVHGLTGKHLYNYLPQDEISKISGFNQLLSQIENNSNVLDSSVDLLYLYLDPENIFADNGESYFQKGISSGLSTKSDIVALYDKVRQKFEISSEKDAKIQFWINNLIDRS